jgi:hypothetical protein
VTNGRLHQQLEWAFKALTREHSPRLTERIRQSLWGQPLPATTPAAFPAPAGALIAVVAVIALLAAVFLEAPTVASGIASLGHQVANLKSPFNPPPVLISPGPTSHATLAPTSPTPAPTPESSPTPTPTAAATPVPPRAPAAAPLAGYSCSGQSGGASGQTAVTSARTGPHSGFDRFVLEFNGTVAQFTVEPQGDANFLPAGAANVQLQGTAGLMVTLHGATGSGSFSGSNDIQPGLPAIREAKLLTDAGGVVQWGIGLARQDCFHVFTLTGPNRLVIDVQN